MPYRHLKYITKIYEIIDIFIELYNNSIDNDKQTCKKYLYATLNNIYKYINSLYLTNNLTYKKIENINKNIFDSKSLIFNTNYFINEKSSVFINIYKEFLKINKNATFIISLSGGVDSMVALYILKLISKKSNITIIALHINYNNRKESTDELDFVNYYCNYLNIKLIYRTISEITRDKCLHNGLRDLYEDITKQIRYDMYKCLIVNTNTYVVLGHNKDDCFENIITNISNCNNYNNLSGMDSEKRIDDINFWRPMLNINKTDIIIFANYNNIPYLVDSTPIWSVRGKIRDQLKPILQNLKSNNDNNDNSIIDSFFILKDSIINYNKIINDIIVNNLIEKIKYIDNNTYFAIYNNNEFYSLKYIIIFSAFLEKLNIQASNKAIREFIIYINNYKQRKFILSKKWDIIITHENENYKILINSKSHE